MSNEVQPAPIVPVVDNAANISDALNVFTVNASQPAENNNFQTIQAAIDAAPDSERQVIQISPGTYTERLSIGKPVILVGMGDVVTAQSGTVNKCAVILNCDWAPGHQITSTCTFKNMFLGKFDNSSILINATAFDGSQIDFENCLFDAPGTSTYLLSLNRVSGSVLYNLIKCSTLFSGEAATRLLNVGNSVIVNWYDAQTAVGNILIGSSSTLVLDNFGTITYQGKIENIGSNSTLSLKDSNISTFDATPCVSSTNAFASVIMRETQLFCTNTNAISLSGANSTFQYRTLQFRVPSNAISVNGLVRNLNNPTFGTDANILMVNATAPQVGNNYRTIQAAIDAVTSGEHAVICIAAGEYSAAVNVNKEVTICGVVPFHSRGYGVIETNQERGPVTINGLVTINAPVQFESVFFRNNNTAQSVITMGGSWAVTIPSDNVASFANCGLLAQSDSVPAIFLGADYSADGIVAQRRFEFDNCRIGATGTERRAIEILHSNRVTLNNTSVLGVALLSGSAMNQLQHFSGSHWGRVDGQAAISLDPAEISYVADKVRFLYDGIIHPTILLGRGHGAKITSCTFDQEDTGGVFGGAIVINHPAGGVSNGDYITDGLNRFANTRDLVLNGGQIITYAAENVA